MLLHNLFSPFLFPYLLRCHHPTIFSLFCTEKGTDGKNLYLDGLVYVWDHIGSMISVTKTPGSFLRLI